MTVDEMTNRLFLSDSGLRISKPGFDARLSLPESQILFDSARPIGVSIIQRGRVSLTLNFNPGTTINFPPPGYIPAVIVNRVVGNTYYPIDFISATNFEGPYFQTLWGYRVYNNRFVIHKHTSSDRNGNDIPDNRVLEFAYCVFRTRLGAG